MVINWALFSYYLYNGLEQQMNTAQNSRNSLNRNFGLELILIFYFFLKGIFCIDVHFTAILIINIPIIYFSYSYFPFYSCLKKLKI